MSTAFFQNNRPATSSTTSSVIHDPQYLRLQLRNTRRGLLLAAGYAESLADSLSMFGSNSRLNESQSAVQIISFTSGQAKQLRETFESEDIFNSWLQAMSHSPNCDDAIRRFRASAEFLRDCSFPTNFHSIAATSIGLPVPSTWWLSGARQRRVFRIYEAIENVYDCTPPDEANRGDDSRQVDEPTAEAVSRTPGSRWFNCLRTLSSIWAIVCRKSTGAEIPYEADQAAGEKANGSDREVVTERDESCNVDPDLSPSKRRPILMLSDVESASLRKTMEEGPNSKARRNAHAVLLTAAGYSYRQTGRILFVGEGTIGRVVRMYKKRPNRTPEAVDAYRQNLWS